MDNRIEELLNYLGEDYLVSFPLVGGKKDPNAAGYLKRYNDGPTTLFPVEDILFFMENRNLVRPLIDLTPEALYWALESGRPMRPSYRSRSSIRMLPTVKGDGDKALTHYNDLHAMMSSVFSYILSTYLGPQ